MAMGDIGIIGLAVMGENLVLNMESKGFTVSVYNRTKENTINFIEGKAKNKNIIGTFRIQDLIGSLKTPRKVMLMVKAGKPVDDLIDGILPYLERGDIIIDGGNSHYLDTIRRTEYVEKSGFYYIGTGISGGEEGALKGPSIMPGGSYASWNQIKPIFQSIAAKVEDGIPCCDWIGDNGAGHFVKMVHNGIEYGDMQLICEAYMLLRDYLAMDADEMQQVFRDWNTGKLNSYLMEITGDILAFKDDDNKPLIDKILDTAGQKGTGKWMSIASLDEGVPLTLITEAVYARFLSAAKEERINASKVLTGPSHVFEGNRELFINDIKHALYASKIVSYAQGFALMKSTEKVYGWSLKYGDIALLWRNGCIIRSVFLERIKDAFDKSARLDNILLDSFFRKEIEAAQEGWRRVVSAAALYGISVPALSSALSYYDGYRCKRLPANLLQAQRDYFGAHTYERIDKERGKFYHTNWKREAVK